MKVVASDNGERGFSAFVILIGLLCVTIVALVGFNVYEHYHGVRQDKVPLHQSSPNVKWGCFTTSEGKRICS